MDPEKQRWLQEALNNMTVDVVKELANCILALQSNSVSVILIFKLWILQNLFKVFFRR